MSGYGPPPDAAPEPDARAGYQIVVTRVREGLPGIPSHGGVEREVSTKVIVVVATEFEPAAAATLGAATECESHGGEQKDNGNHAHRHHSTDRLHSLPPGPEREAIVSYGQPFVFRAERPDGVVQSLSVSVHKWNHGRISGHARRPRSAGIS